MQRLRELEGKKLKEINRGVVGRHQVERVVIWTAEGQVFNSEVFLVLIIVEQVGSLRTT